MLFVTAIAWFVGGATMLGAALGFVIKKETPRVRGGVLAFASGLMTAAAALELIAPALTAAPGEFGLAAGGVAAGALFVVGMGASAPLFRRLGGRRLLRDVPADRTPQVKKALLFVLAIAVHNVPEGFAAGVACAGNDRAGAFAVALGIALQNVPEGMILIPPMLSAGLPRRRTLLIALSTGLVEVAGAYLGRGVAASPLTSLSFLPAFAGGAMLYIVAAETQPEAFAAGGERVSGLGFLAGFCVMLVTSRIL